MMPALVSLVAILILISAAATGPATPAAGLRAALVLGVPIVVWAHHARVPARRVLR